LCRVVAFRFGAFSHLWIDMMERLGLDVIKVEVPWGEGVPEDKLAEILKKDTEKKIKAVTVVHNETTTGTLLRMGRPLSAQALVLFRIGYHRGRGWRGLESMAGN